MQEQATTSPDPSVTDTEEPWLTQDENAAEPDDPIEATGGPEDSGPDAPVDEPVGATHRPSLP